MNIKFERIAKAAIYTVLALITAFVALETADCQEFGRLLYDKGNSDPGQTARFYFLTLLSLAVIIVQNAFLRRALHRMEQNTKAIGTGPSQEQ